MLKILFIALRYDYGDPERGGGFYFHNHFDVLGRMPGVDVKFFGLDDGLVPAKKSALNQRLLDTVESFKPQLCFFCLHENEIAPKTLEQVSRTGSCVTLNWFGDDHWRFDGFSKHYAPYFHWVATTFLPAVQKYHQLGLKKVISTQWAANTYQYRPVARVKDIDISFVGSKNKSRLRTIKILQRAGFRVQVWGTGWPDGRLSQKKMVEIFSRSKISLGLNTPQSYIGLKPLARLFLKKNNNLVAPDLGSVVSNWRQWLDQRQPVIKARMFEIPACGTLMMTQTADNLDEYYTDGQDVVLYLNSADLINKVKYYLSHPEAREKISRHGLARTVAEHTYQTRFKRIFNLIGL